MPDRNQVSPGSRFTFILKINKTPTAFIETKQEPGRNIFMHYIIWILMPDWKQVRPGSRFTLS